MANATVRNVTTFDVLPTSSQSPTSGTQFTNKTYIDANYLSSSTNPGVTYTGTLVTPIIATLTTFGQITYSNGTISAPLLSAAMALQTEPFLVTMDTGTIGDVALSTNYAPLLTTITMPNALSFSFSPGATSLLFSTITAPNAQIFTFGGTAAAMTTLSLPSATRSSGFNMTAPLLTTLSLPVLMTANNVAIVAAALTTLSLPSLAYTASFSPTAAAVTTFSIPVLALVSGAFTINFPVLTSCSVPSLVSVIGAFTTTLALATSVSFPLLANCSGVFTMTLASVTTLTLTALATITTNLALTCAALTTFSLPAIVSVGTTFVITAANLVTFSLGSTLKSIGGNFTMSGMKLDQASVNGILVSLAALDGTNGTTAYSSKTINISGGTSASPNGAGATAKTTLQGRGCTVTTN